MTLEALRYWSTQALLGLIIVGAGMAAIVVALAPSPYHQHAPITPDVVQQPISSIFTPTLQIQSPVPVQTPTSVRDALFGLYGGDN
jgi:hypothetical protein